MTNDAVLLTPDGLTKLTAELDELRTKGRAEVALAIHEAQELGMSQIDGQYEDAKNQQAFVEGRIVEIEKLLERATVIDEEAAHHSKIVQVGSNVTVKSEKGKSQKYHIVGSAEANPAEGRISHESPVGRALIGKKRGEKVTVATPRGAIDMTVTSVS
jgi:transcription elongation factor GreA